ncbi:thioesterase II family protein [Streptomyces sp. MUM 178J]|uniref:thioesterase II family protein n=1 Tax=Streptomyces sp. MUM 178J TaxID=2791991 RepID=UPI001F03C9F0|nr:alpha/beta fold hydrolase [Streptomyces sp. MUM 178J]WRQ80355.1 alpha/beta fold hydrolase [Streptomyces sp. MUM 178J]
MTRHTDMDPDRWIRCFHPKPGARHTLVCFPHAGGSASYYFGLSAALAPDVEMLVVQYPGRENRLFEEPASSLAQLADHTAGALRSRPLSQPVLFGHSMGAIAAFEVARRLEQPFSPAAPAALIASACAAPSHHANRADRLSGIEDEQDTEVLARVMGLGGTAEGVAEHEELVRLFIPALRADLRALRDYRSAPDAAVSCPVTVCTADGDPDVRAAEAGEWSRHTTAGAELHLFEGDHFYLGARPQRFMDLLHRTVRTARTGVSFA